MAEPLLIVFGVLLMVFGIAIWLGMIWGYIYFFYPPVAQDVLDFLKFKIYRPITDGIVCLLTLTKRVWMNRKD